MGKRNWFLIVGVIGLTLFGVPLRRTDIAPNDESLFNDYIVKFNKTYKDSETEYMIRMENFKQSLKLINELNKNRSNNLAALYGLTVYADMSQEEFRQMKLQTNHFSSKIPGNTSKHSSIRKHNPNDSEEKTKHRHKLKMNTLNNNIRLKRTINKLPAVVDWRKKKVIGSVHNQKTCGACWAFSTIETMEAMNAMKNRTFLALSVQEAIDCARDGNYGCEGGDSCSLLKWLVDTKTKITTEKAYPFAYHTQACRLNVSVGIQVHNFSCDEYISQFCQMRFTVFLATQKDKFKFLSSYVGAEEMLLEKLAYHGPVAAAVNAINWQYYLGGIIQFHCSGSSLDMNHAVQIVGYDKRGPVPYYIIRNSWGSEFGDNGYLYIAIGSNICGIANEVTSLDVV